MVVIERARKLAVEKPWGVTDVAPWGAANVGGAAIGELWYERADKSEPSSALLLKLLFTSQPLSIQVHPDDAYARQIGLPNGKTEAWYVLAAAPNAKVALGLKKQFNKQQVNNAAHDGTIASLVDWRHVSADDVVSVPAGTIHAIGAGLVIAEIQQRSDATFRMFDHGRQRELHIDHAVAVAIKGPATLQVHSVRLGPMRTVLVSNHHFVLERLDLPPLTIWTLEAIRETWLLALGGDGAVGPYGVEQGAAIFAQSDQVDIRAGDKGLTVLLAYQGVPHSADRLQGFGQACTAAAYLFVDKPDIAPSTAEGEWISRDPVESIS